MNFKNLLAAIVCIAIAQTASAQLQIVNNSNAQALAQKLVGSGVTISNVTLTGSPLSTGFFYNQGGTQLGLDSGIVLSTGRVLTAGFENGLNGPASLLASSHVSSGGDPDLNVLVNPKPTNNAVVLEFDFVAVGESVVFRYVFSSDEYPTYNCTNFNDVFAFFINGPGITGNQNIALVPGTNIPVAINTINSGIPGAGGSIADCNAMGEGSPFTDLYINNMGNQYFTHNGHTVVLEAKAQVQPCQVYHLKIAIADVQDFSFDSGVFLEAESLKSDPISIVSANPDLNGEPYLVEGCHTGGIHIVRDKKSPYPQQVNLSYAGTTTMGVDISNMPSTAQIPANDSVVFVPISPIVDNVDEGIETLKIYISNGCILTGVFLDSIEIQLRDYDTLNVTPDGQVAACGTNGNVQLNANGNYSSFQWFPATGLSDASIASPLASPSENTVYYCTANTGSCNAMDSVSVVMKKLDLLGTEDVPCFNGTTGKIEVGGGWEWQAPLSFSINNGNYVPGSLFENLPVGTHTVKIKDATGCVDSMEVTLNQSFPTLEVEENIITASCTGSNGQVTLSASGGLPSYSFAVDNSAFVAGTQFTVSGGVHDVYVKDQNGCITTKQVNVANDPAIEITSTTLPASCTGNADGTVNISATGGSGVYEYSINGSSYLPSNSFNVNAGDVTLYVKDDKGCTASVIAAIPFDNTATVDAGADVTICEGASVQLQATSSGSAFSWNNIPGLSSYQVADPEASPVVTTDFIVQATTGICTVADTIRVNVIPAPIPNAGNDTSVCIGGTIMLQASGGIAYSWIPAGQMSDPNIPNPTVKPQQSGNFYVRVTSADGCPSLRYDTVFVQLIPSVQAFAGRDTSITIGQPLQLNAFELGNSGVTRFEWTPSTGLSSTNIPDPIATLDRDITYQVTMTTPEGCEGTDYITIKVFKGPEIYVPSGFTPNGDGRNDMLKVIPVGIKELRYFRVYNRWGQMVFSTVNEGIGWNGTISGKTQPTGTFIWVAEGVDFTGKLIQRKGTVTLIR